MNFPNEQGSSSPLKTGNPSASTSGPSSSYIIDVDVIVPSTDTDFSKFPEFQRWAKDGGDVRFRFNPQNPETAFVLVGRPPKKIATFSVDDDENTLGSLIAERFAQRLPIDQDHFFKYIPHEQRERLQENISLINIGLNLFTEFEQFEKANKYFQLGFANLSPQDKSWLGECQLRYATSLRVTQKYEDAAQQFQEAFQQHDQLHEIPHDYYIHYGAALYALQDNEDALRYFQEGFRRCPLEDKKVFARSQIEFAQLLSLSKQHEEATKNFEEGFAHLTEDQKNETGKAYTQYGVSLSSLGQHEKAVECFEKGISLLPQMATVRRNDPVFSKHPLFQKWSQQNDAITFVHPDHRKHFVAFATSSGKQLDVIAKDTTLGGLVAQRIPATRKRSNLYDHSKQILDIQASQMQRRMNANKPPSSKPTQPTASRPAARIKRQDSGRPQGELSLAATLQEPYTTFDKGTIAVPQREDWRKQYVIFHSNAGHAILLAKDLLTQDQNSAIQRAGTLPIISLKVPQNALLMKLFPSDYPTKTTTPTTQIKMQTMESGTLQLSLRFSRLPSSTSSSLQKTTSASWARRSR